MTTANYPSRYMMLSSELFSWFLQLPSLIELQKALVSFLNLSQAVHEEFYKFTTPSSFEINFEIDLVWTAPLETVNGTHFYRLMPDLGTRRQLLVGETLSGQLRYCTWFDNIGSKSRTSRPLNALELVNFHRLALCQVHGYERDFGKGYRCSSTAYKAPYANLTSNYAGHHDTGCRMRYKIIGPRLPADYTIEKFQNEYQDYRATFASLQNLGDRSKPGKPLRLPFEILDTEYANFSLYSYLSNVAPKVQTVEFMNNIKAGDITRVLEAIPNFKYRFNDHQRQVIGDICNLIVIGRSGTGKTTCAVLRMIGMRLLEIANANQRAGVYKIRYADLCQPSQIKMVFLTASPLLARAVSKMYNKVLEYLKTILKKKESQTQASTPSAVNPAGKVNASAEEQKMAQGVLADFDLAILDEEEKEIDQLIGEIDLEKNPDDIPTTMRDLTLDKYPLFLTVKEYVYLLESLCIRRNFFQRTLKNTIMYGVDPSRGKRGAYRFKRNYTTNRIFHDILLARSSEQNDP